VYSANRRSSSSARGPVVSQPERIASVTAATSSSPTAGGWKDRNVLRRTASTRRRLRQRHRASRPPRYRTWMLRRVAAGAGIALAAAGTHGANRPFPTFATSVAARATSCALGTRAPSTPPHVPRTCPRRSTSTRTGRTTGPAARARSVASARQRSCAATFADEAQTSASAAPVTRLIRSAARSARSTACPRASPTASTAPTRSDPRRSGPRTAPGSG
jgi:hypothetical protein